MNTKLTLSLDKATIERAKSYAQAHHTSLSSMVNGYFRVVTIKKNTPREISPLVKELSGIIPKKFNLTKKRLRKEYTDYLWKKYQ